MAKVYRNKKEIPIPSGLLINHYDGRVYRLERDSSGKRKRTVFGYATSESTMHVNDTFKSQFPNLWKEYYGSEELHEYNLRCGLYALLLGAGYKSDLYPTVQDAFGPLHGNVIMDFSIYSLLTRSNVLQLFEETMKDQVLFSNRCYSDSWFSSFFSNNMNENQIHDFKLKWIDTCIKSGVKKVWISVDGSNHDNQSNVEDLVDKGHSKSRRNITLISYIYAIDAETGLPITYFVNNGSMVDSKAFNEVCSFLNSKNLEIEGFIVDKGFCTHEVLKELEENKNKYVIMLPKNNYGHESMIKEHSEDIRWKVDQCISENGIFGMSERKKLFKNYNIHSYINTYFDGSNATNRAISLINKVFTAAEKIKEQIKRGETVQISEEMSKYISIEGEGSERKIVYNHELWQSDVDGKGYYSIASSEDFGAKKTYELYKLRAASEVQYMILKSMEGQGISRTQSAQGIHSKMCICFITSILRNIIMQACKKLKLDTSRMLVEVNRVKLQLRNEDTYFFVRNLSKRQESIFKELGIEIKDFDTIAKDVTSRKFNAINSQIHVLPSTIETNKAKRGRPKTTTPKEKQDKKIGRPKGSLNKKTLERLEKEKANPELKKPKRKPGRPKGSLGAKTLERKAQLEAEKPKRKPGRPKGSLSKKTLQKLEEEKKKKLIEKEKRKPGRPKGSLNKKTLERIAKSIDKNGKLRLKRQPLPTQNEPKIIEKNVIPKVENAKNLESHPNPSIIRDTIDIT